MQTAKWQPPTDKTLSVIDTTVEQPNDDKVVIIHEKTHTPKFGDKGEFVDWWRKEVVVRNSGSIECHQTTERYNYDSEQLETVNDNSHTVELVDDNETVPHSGKHWVTHYKEHSNKCTNLRWKALRENKPEVKSTKEAMKEKIEANI